jgi:hypothetical protein
MIYKYKKVEVNKKLILDLLNSSHEEKLARLNYI